MQKKKIEVIIPCTEPETVEKYLTMETKIVVINVFDKYWGPSRVVDPMVKRFIESGSNENNVVFISIEKELTGETFKSYEFKSKPKFFICFKGQILQFIDGVDMPLLLGEVEKSFALLDA